MDFNGDQLENNPAGYTANNSTDNLVEILYNSSISRNAEIGGGTVTLYLPEAVKKIYMKYIFNYLIMKYY